MTTLRGAALRRMMSGASALDIVEALAALDDERYGAVCDAVRAWDEADYEGHAAGIAPELSLAALARLNPGAAPAQLIRLQCLAGVIEEDDAASGYLEPGEAGPEGENQ